MRPGAFITFPLEQPADLQTLYISPLEPHFDSGGSAVMSIEGSSILDSGSARHIHRSVHITDHVNVHSLAGFEGSQA